MNLPTLARTTAVGVVVTLGVAAFIAGAAHRFFDYDEIYHAHATWLIAQGYRPFHDFQSSHLPFLWYPLALLWWIRPDSPATLLPLRFVAGLGTLLSVVGIMACMAAARREIPVRWLIVAMALVAFNRAILDYAVEFRPDSWSTALLFLAFFLLLRSRPVDVGRRYAVFGVLAALAVLSSPKLVLLPVLFTVVDLVGRIRRRDNPGAALAGCAAGVGAAALAALVVLRIARVDPKLAFEMAISYQWVFARNNAFGLGLFASVIQQPQLMMVVAGGAVAWGAYLLEAHERPVAYEIGVLLFLLAELATADRPYKQYYGPWFLLAASFVPFVGLYLDRTVPRAAPWCFALAILFSGWGAWGTFLSFSRQDQAGKMLAFYGTMLRFAPAEATIVAFPPLHPMIRRDGFYGWSRTTDPGGYGTEAIMRALDVPGYSQRFERDHYRHELETNAPALVVSALGDDSAYEPVQWAVLREYLTVHRDDYVFVERGLLRPLWIRRDRINHVALEQLTGPAERK